MKLHFDYETRGVLALDEVGTARYFGDPRTEILMCAYAFGDGEIKVWQKHLGPMPEELKTALENDAIIKVAWNSMFEHTATEKKVGVFIPFEAMKDPSVGARHLSIPGNLEEAGEILGLPEEFLKNADRGAVLRKMFTEPIQQKKRKPASDSPDTLFGDLSPKPEQEEQREYRFRDWTTNPSEWNEFVEYCRQDVKAERAIEKLVDAYPLPETEKRMWILDQKINYRGIAADEDYAIKCFELAKKNRGEFIDKAKVITKLENPNSTQKMLEWARMRGYPYNSLRKEPVRAVMGDPEMSKGMTQECKDALAILKYCKKNSYMKLKAISAALSEDKRLRNQFLFMGSPRAGRWAGRDVQLQNMARPIKALEKKGTLTRAIQLIKALDYAGLKVAFPDDPVIDVVTSCIRSAFVAQEGKRLDVSDLNAIENRVLGWVSGEQAILAVFTTPDAMGRPKCPYLDFASFWFNIPYETLKTRYDAGDPEAKFMRQISKPAVLGCGYRQAGGGWTIDPKTGDRVKTGLWKYAEDMFCPMTKEQAHEAVAIFRKRYKKVVSFWYDVERAVIRCIKTGGTEWLGPTEKVWCDRRKCKNGKFMLRIHLPSGRCLHYLNVNLQMKVFEGTDGKPYEKETIFYDGIDSKSQRKVWGPVATHGGKLTENIVQAIARDILVEALLLADETGLFIVGHVHDEIITENSEAGFLDVDDLRWCMSQPMKWAPDLPLTAEGWSGYYYKK